MLTIRRKPVGRLQASARTGGLQAPDRGRGQLVSRYSLHRTGKLMESLLGPKRRLRDVCYSAAVGGQADIRRTGDFNVAGAEVLSISSFGLQQALWVQAVDVP